MTRRDAAFLLPAALLLGAAAALGWTGGAQALAPRLLLLGALCLALLCALTRPGAKAVTRVKDGSFGAYPERSEITFNDVAANGAARSSLMELCDYLKNPEKYQKLGARMPRGVLLYGPPGTGKTLLARALAGEAGVPFYAMSGSDFVQMYAGVGASRVRELFAKARKAGRAVIFIDEIDALGRSRDDMSSDERDQTLNALLSEMSGFREVAGTLVVAATNRFAALDPALIRPGRFDRQIEVGLPGREERLAILKVSARGVKLSAEANLSELAARTVSFSGASLGALVNEAAILAAGRGAEAVCPDDIDRAYFAAVAGADQPIRASGEELKTIALHEAGHALATLVLCPERTVSRVSILPTAKGAAGYSLSVPEETALARKDRLYAQIRVLLAGRAAEALIGEADELTGGAADDLQKATDLAAACVMDYALEGEIYLSERRLQKSTGAGTQARERVANLLRAQYEAVYDLLAERAATLVRIAGALVEKEALTGEELTKIAA